MNYLKRRNIFKKKIFFSVDTNIDNVSNIWKKLRKDFKSEKKSYRSYAISIISQKKINLYLSISRFIKLTFKCVDYVLEKIKFILLKSLDWMIFKSNLNTTSRHDWEICPMDIYCKKKLNYFFLKYSKYNITFSHNTFKAFSYMLKLKEYVKLNKNIKILEIGAGLFNFGHLLTYELKKFNYIICDLPEVIIAAHQQITDIYLPICKGKYDVFLPNEINLFYESNNDRKILFITPKQLNKDIMRQDTKFDLFINHESFSEMNICTVNKYLKQVKFLMKKGAIINLVNRHSRVQATTYEEYKLSNLKNITCFDDYELNFCNTILKEVDKFRSTIPILNKDPNVFFIGKVNL
jgi:putative sugar O-methyltransferase